MNSLAIGFLLKWGIGTAAGAVALVGAAGAVVMVNGDDDGDTPASQETATPVETAEGDATPAPADDETPEPTPGVPDEVMGQEVQEFEVGTDGSIPAQGVILLDTGCWGCDGGGTTSVRARAAADGGETISEVVELPTQDQVSQVISSESGLGVLFAVTCRDGCSAMGPVNVDEKSTVWRSADGGFTWSEVTTLPGYVSLLRVDGADVLVSHTSIRENREEQTTDLIRLPGGEVVEPDIDGAREHLPPQPLVLNGQLVYFDADRRALVDEEGDIVWQPDLDPEPAEDAAISIATSPVGDVRIVEWSLGGPYTLTAVYRGTSLSAVYTSAAGFDSRRISRWFEDGQGLGTAHLTDAEIGIDQSVEYPRPLPAVIDCMSGTLVAVGPQDIGTEFQGRARVITFLPGPLAQVSGAGTCLNVRTEPATDGEVIDCYVDNVLLRDLGETEEADGFEWVQVETPTGQTGWAATDFLER